MEQDVIVGTKFGFLRGAVIGAVKHDVQDWEAPDDGGPLVAHQEYEVVIVTDTNRTYVAYSTKEERDADYDLIVASL